MGELFWGALQENPVIAPGQLHEKCLPNYFDNHFAVEGTPTPIPLGPPITLSPPPLPLSSHPLGSFFDAAGWGRAGLAHGRGPRAQGGGGRVFKRHFRPDPHLRVRSKSYPKDPSVLKIVRRANSLRRENSVRKSQNATESGRRCLFL